MYDGGITYAHGQEVHWLNHLASTSAWCLFLFQIPFLINLFVSWKKGAEADDNPWEATTLEWATPTPPPHGNFERVPSVYRGPYEYSVPGHPADFTPQHLPEGARP
jgi:cytochrome c oxidase subunit 1